MSNLRAPGGPDLRPVKMRDKEVKRWCMDTLFAISVGPH